MNTARRLPKSGFEAVAGEICTDSSPVCRASNSSTDPSWGGDRQGACGGVGFHASFCVFQPGLNELLQPAKGFHALKSVDHGAESAPVGHRRLPILERDTLFVLLVLWLVGNEHGTFFANMPGILEANIPGIVEVIFSRQDPLAPHL